jgi:hypothetical protein
MHSFSSSIVAGCWAKPWAKQVVYLELVGVVLFATQQCIMVLGEVVAFLALYRGACVVVPFLALYWPS